MNRGINRVDVHMACVFDQEKESDSTKMIACSGHVTQ